MRHGVKAKGTARGSKSRAAVHHEKPETQTEKKSMDVAKPRKKKSQIQLGVEAPRAHAKSPHSLPVRRCKDQCEVTRPVPKSHPVDPGMADMASHHECKLAYLAPEVTPPAAPYVTEK